MKKVIFLFLTIFAVTDLFAQNKIIDSLRQALSKAKTDSEKIRLLNHIGSQFSFYQESYDSSLKYLQRAVNLSEKTNDVDDELSSRLTIARDFWQTGNFPDALKASLYNLHMAKKFHKSWFLFFQTRMTGWIYRDMGNNQKHLEYEKQLMPLVNLGVSKDTAYLRTVANNCIAAAYLDMNIPDSALLYEMPVYKHGIKTKDPMWLMISTLQLGSMYAKLKKNDSSFLFYKKCIPYAIKKDILGIAGNAELGMAGLFQKEGKMDSAFFYAKQSQEKLQATHSIALLVNVDSLLSNMFKSRRQYDSAYSYLQNYVALKDSFYNQRKIMQAQNFSFNETLQQQRIEQAKKEAQQQYKTKIKFYILVATILIILIIVFLLLKNNRNKQKANRLLSEQKEKIQSTLSELKSTQKQLIQSEKMASLGELTAGIAHEIQNPLNFVNNFSEVNRELIGELKVEHSKPKAERNEQQEDNLLRDIDANEEKILHHGKRADAIVKGMLQHSRGSSGQKEPTDINALADEYLRLSYHGMRAKDKNFNTTIKTDFDELIGKINIVPGDIGRVLLNLYNNAFYAASLPREGEAKDPNDRHVPTVWVSTKKEGSEIMIRVRDNGPGISDAIKDKIFQPFFTTKPTGEGTGLGLSLSYDIIKAHDGEIKIGTKEGEGTEFTVILPDNNSAPLLPPSGRK